MEEVPQEAQEEVVPQEAQEAEEVAVPKEAAGFEGERGLRIDEPGVLNERPGGLCVADAPDEIKTISTSRRRRCRP